MVIGKHIKKLYISLVILVICGAFINIYFYNKNKSQYTSEPNTPTNKYHRIQSTGFHLNHYDDNNNELISIRGDKLSVEKKKIGFFRTSLLNEAKLSNAVIDFHGTVIFLKDSTGIQKKKEIVTFKNAFSKNILSSLFGKGVSSIYMAPVSLRLYQDDSLITKISASSGYVKIKQRVLAFTGEVVVESGTSKLTTGSLTFNPDEAIIKSNTEYELTRPEGHFRGKQFQSDIFLQSGYYENKS